MKTSHDGSKPSKTHTIKAGELILSPHSRNGDHHEKQLTQITSKWAHPKNHEENTMPPQADDILLGQRGAQMSDVCNGSFSLGHVSEEINLNSSEKIPHQDSNANRNKDRVLKKSSAVQKVRNEPKDSPSKDVFLFWANKVSNSSKGSRTFPKLLQKSSVTAGNSSPALLPQEGLSLKEENQTEKPQRKTRRDLFSDTNVFSHIDTHVLHVSQQVGPAVPQQTHVLIFNF